MKLYSLFHLRDSGRTHISLWCSMLQGVSFISFPQPALSMSVVLGGCLCFHNTLSQSPENSCGLVAFSWALDTGRWRMQWWNGLWKDKNWSWLKKREPCPFCCIILWFIETPSLLWWISPFKIHDYRCKVTLFFFYYYKGLISHLLLIFWDSTFCFLT